MPAKLTTHALDTTRGRPAAHLRIDLARAGQLLKTVHTNPDDRTDQPLLSGGDFTAGDYELVFHIGDYFGDTVFLDQVPIRFRVRDPTQNHHVPLLCSPWAYSTHRGS